MQELSSPPCTWLHLIDVGGFPVKSLFSWFSPKSDSAATVPIAVPPTFAGSDHDSLEALTQQRGRHLLAQMRAQRRGLSAIGRDVSNVLLDWAMSDAEFKVQLFRFVDVFPTLQTPEQINDLLRDYLEQPGVTLPSGLDFGLKAGRTMKGTMARTIAGQIRRMAETFIAGSDIDEALPKLRQAWMQGMAASVDLLGEACLSHQEAAVYHQRYRDLIGRLASDSQQWPTNETLERDHLGPIPRANVSVKLSALVADIKVEDFEGSVERLYQSLAPLLEYAASKNVFVNFDMEQSTYKDLTLAVFRRCCESIPFSAGIALQSYLRSGPKDAEELISWARRTDRIVTVRLIKGAYWDYEVIRAEQEGWPTPVWTTKEATDASFEQMARQLIAATPRSDREGGIKLALGSHNARSIAHAQAVLDAAGLPREALEYQVLEGMADELKNALIAEGHRVRNYVPLGEMIPGMAYLVRRLLENTSNESWLRGNSNDRPVDELLKAPRLTQLAEDKGPSRKTEAERQGLSASVEGIAEAQPFLNEPFRDFADAQQRRHFAEAVRCATLPSPPAWVPLEGLKQAISTAQASQRSWEATDVRKRAEVLLRGAALMRHNRDQLAASVLLESGKTWREADADVCEAIDFCEFYAREAVALFRGERLGKYVGEDNRTGCFPVGVAGIISPWNFPLAICAGMTVAALVTGNAALVKPAEQTSVVGQVLCELLWESGAPRDILHFVPGPGETIGAGLVEDPRVGLIAFTGSRAVGLQILATSGHLQAGQEAPKKVVCEMGGKNAIIIDATADLDEAVQGVCRSAFGYAGQKCSACSRVIVLRDHYDLFMQRLVAMTRSLNIGDPRDPATDIGPVIDEDAAANVRRHLERAFKTHRLACAVEPSTEVAARFGNRLIGPHIFTDVDVDAALAQEEIFGPVLAVIRADSFEQALAFANRSVYKLTAAVYSRTPAHLAEARRRLRVGNLYVNRGSTGALVGRQPFGGFGQSGTGTKAGGREYLRHFVHATVTSENSLRRGFAPGLS